MKVKYYYLRNRENEPVVTVCLIKDEEEWTRGWSLCSHNDSPVKKQGRDKAYGMAMKALTNKKSGVVFGRLESFNVLDSVRHNFKPHSEVEHPLTANFGCKSVYMPKLYKFEKRMLKMEDDE